MPRSALGRAFCAATAKDDRQLRRARRRVTTSPINWTLEVALVFELGRMNILVKVEIFLVFYSGFNLKLMN